MIKIILASAILSANSILAQKLDTLNSPVRTVLHRLEQNNSQTQSLSYHVMYEATQLDMKDSAFRSEGQVWLSRLSSDSIFGCRFHVSGQDRNGAFDYYYDGQSSYEIRHANRTITVFHPNQYPNNPNNPAKARAALYLFVDLLFKNGVAESLLHNIKNASLDSQGNLLLLRYLPNEYGQIATLKIQLDSQGTEIAETETEVEWRGITYTTIVTIQSVQRNPDIREEDIALTRQYPDYIINEFSRPQSGDSSTAESLVGSVAPDLSFPDITGDSVSLSKLKGKIVLLDFWESWCGYCLLAFPKLNELDAEYKVKGLSVIGVTTENPKQVRRLAQANGLKYRNLVATPEILQKYNVSNRPTYILIDRTGRIQKVSFGDLNLIKAKLLELIY